jgi:hypothetical protein
VIALVGLDVPARVQQWADGRYPTPVGEAEAREAV